MSYDFRGGGGLEYHPCRYGQSKLVFRGPKKQLDRPYVAFLGGTETYGKFVPTPYPALLEQRMQADCLNLGHPNAGVDAFLNDPEVLHLCNGATATVIQLSGVHNTSNRFYTVHPRRNDRFVRASDMLRACFRDVDFAPINFTRHLLSALETASPERFSIVVAEVRAAYTARLRTLVGRIDTPVFLLWWRDASTWVGFDAPTAGTRDPLFVNRQMIDALADDVAGCVEVPVPSEAFTDVAKHMVYDGLDHAAADALMPIAAHELASEKLAERLKDLQI